MSKTESCRDPLSARRPLLLPIPERAANPQKLIRELSRYLAQRLYNPMMIHDSCLDAVVTRTGRRRNSNKSEKKAALAARYSAKRLLFLTTSSSWSFSAGHPYIKYRTGLAGECKASLSGRAALSCSPISLLKAVLKKTT